MDAAVRALVETHLRTAGSSWSIGGFGAIAEFIHVAHVPASVDGLRAVSALGAIALDPHAALTPIAYEIPSANADYWQHGVVLCHPIGRALHDGTIADLGIDAGALGADEAGGRLFDLGVGAETFRFCVRTHDPEIVRALESSAGAPFAAHAARLAPLLIHHSPTRVVLCAAGRIEVYQPIAEPDGRTPDGPHTHLIPKLLRPRQTHSLNIPVPAGLVPLVTLYPAHPLTDSAGRRKPFAPREHEQFQSLLEGYGDAKSLVSKREIIARIHGGAAPESWRAPDSRHARLATRVGLRQMLHAEGDSAALSRWRARWDARPGAAAAHSH